jgi:predicted nucleotidyltransferase
LLIGYQITNRKMAIEPEQLDRAIALAKSFGATRLILFGSAAGTPNEAGDLDLACDGVSGWKFYQLGARLEEELKIPLDLISLNPPTRFTRLIERKGKVLV